MNAFIEIFRPFTSSLAGFAVLISAFIGAGPDIQFYLAPVTLAASAAFLFVCAGNALNDYLDVEIDRINKPNRPIPSKRIKPRNVLLAVLILLILCFTISLLINLTCFVIFLFALLLQVFYEIKLKKIKTAGNIIIAFQTGLLFLFGGAATNHFEASGVLALIAFFAIWGREIIKDVEDMEGDWNRRTIPKKIGKRNACILASFLLLLAIFMSFLPYYPLHMFGIVYIPLIFLADSIFLYAIFTQFSNPKKAQKVAKIAMLLSLISFLVASIFKFF